MRCRTAFVLAVSLLFAAPAGAAILHVRADAPGPAHDGASWATAFPRIQPALDAAQPGDEVRVAGGTYREDIFFPRPRVALRGGFAGDEGPEAPPAGQPTTILGFEPQTPVVFLMPESTGSSLRGVTVRREMPGLEAGIRIEATDATIAEVTVRGIGQAGGWGGGVVFWPFSGGTVRDCLIENNTAREGAGIGVRQATVTIARCRITGNIAEDQPEFSVDFIRSGRGGGIASSRGTLIVEDCDISDNTAWDGGAVFLEYGSATVVCSAITHNTADRLMPEWPFQPDHPDQTNVDVTTRGGGVYAWSAEAAFRQCLISENRAVSMRAEGAGYFDPQASGGGLYVPSGRVDLINCTIARNVSHTPSSTGVFGAFYYGTGVTESTGEGTLVNNIIAFNMDDVPGWFDFRAIYGGQGPKWTWRANLVHGNEPRPKDDYEIILGVDEMMGDPMFVDGYRLGPGSAALDRGEVGLLLPGETDHDGNPRIQGRRVDTGAYERVAPPGPSRVYVSTAGDDAADGHSWATAKRTIDAGLAEVSTDGEVWVARGTYPAQPYLYSRVALYGGFAGNETDRAQRDIRANETILDGGGDGRVVYIPSMLADITVDGFTIANGSLRWANGAGVASYGRDIVLSNNIIRDNDVWDSGSYVWASGAGVYASGGPITLSNNIIRDNSASATQIGAPQYANMAWAFGAGLQLEPMHATVTGNLFLRNHAWAGGYGNCGATGSALYASTVTGLIANNTFVESLPWWSTADGAAMGSAVSLWGCGSGLTLANNLIADNNAGIEARESAPVLRHNAFFANVWGNVSGLPDPVGGNGNISADPFFVDRAAGDYRLNAGTPLIDAGDESIVRPGETDLAGNPRILGAHVDIGAYEFVPTSGLTLGHAAWALRVAVGLADVGPSAMATMDLAGDFGALDVRDAVAIARQVANGLDGFDRATRIMKRGLS